MGDILKRADVEIGVTGFHEMVWLIDEGLKELKRRIRSRLRQALLPAGMENAMFQASHKNP
jgi:hypothetical protein